MPSYELLTPTAVRFKMPRKRKYHSITDWVLKLNYVPYQKVFFI